MLRDDRILRIYEVERLVGLKKSVVYQKIRAGSFPRPVALTPRARGWRASELQKYIARLKVAAAS